MPHNDMKGSPPSVFEGDKKAYLAWKTELRLYQLANCNHPTMTNAAEKVLNALGFIWGQSIASSWVEDQLLVLDQNIAQWGKEDW
jgi:hypothetical protein